jgi:hypothetical protein
VVILAPRGEPVGLRRVVALLPRSRTRLFERKRLEVACRDGFAVVPPNFERAEAHSGRRCGVVGVGRKSRAQNENDAVLYQR